MLEAATIERRKNIDVVVGLSQPGACESLRLLLGAFDSVPTVVPAGGGDHAARLDLAAIRLRKPKILLVDPGSALPEVGRALRYDWWTDIEYLIDSGTEVWAAIDATGFSSWATLGVVTPHGINGLSLL